jgi:hypothetical protein
MDKKLIVILLVALALRLVGITHPPYFGDIDWFLNSARDALSSGTLPILGITSSVTWLHQGPLWTYFLLFPLAVHISPLILTIAMSITAIVLVYLLVGLIPALVLTLLPFDITNSQTIYHTTPILLFFYITYGLILRKRNFLSGLFIGLLYQLHLLSFIYWPWWLFLIYRQKLKLWPTLFGFLIGIVPFLIAGPIQTLGVFVWLGKQIVEGFAGVSSGVSTAYWIVLLPGLLLLFGSILKFLPTMLKWVYACWNNHR